jgi:uncharacterized membrane protein YccF (DUF307 family)
MSQNNTPPQQPQQPPQYQGPPQQYPPQQYPPQNMAPPPVVVVNQGGPGCLIRILYFLFIGWWLALIWIVIAWLLNITVVGLPIGLTMLNRVPQIMTLSPGSNTVQITQQANGVISIAKGATQFPMILRIIYFILVGWWLSLIWTVVAYVLSIFPFTWPIGFGMFNIIGFITTLRRN